MPTPLVVMNERTLDYSPKPATQHRPPSNWLALGAAAAMVLLVVALVLPAFRRTSPPAHRVRCMANLRSLGQALLLYSHDHQGKFPAQLNEIWPYVRNVRYFVCPTGTATPSTGATRSEIVADLAKPAHCSYIYVGSTLNANSPKTSIIAYEPPGNHPTPGMNVVFLDGSAAWLDATEGARVIAHLAAGRNPPPPKPSSN